MRSSVPRRTDETEQIQRRADPGDRQGRRSGSEGRRSVPRKRDHRADLLPLVGVKGIADPAQIRIATTSTKGHAAGWSESPAGPLVPDVMLYFCRGSSRLGGYGAASQG